MTTQSRQPLAQTADGWTIGYIDDRPRCWLDANWNNSFPIAATDTITDRDGQHWRNVDGTLVAS